MARTYLLRNRIAGQFAPRLVEMLESVARRNRRIDRMSLAVCHCLGRRDARHSIGPAIREVTALGFVEITEDGRAGNADWRRPNLFRLTYRHVDRANPTNEWHRITEDEAHMIAKGARRQGRKSVGRKQKTGVRNGTIGQCRNGTKNHQIHGDGTYTTRHGDETYTTLDILGGLPRRAIHSAVANNSARESLIEALMQSRSCSRDEATAILWALPDEEAQ